MNGWQNTSQKPDLQLAWLTMNVRLPRRLSHQKVFGFTLAELLIALAILGVIATFTIPKILTSTQNEQFNSAVKEDIGTISAAYRIYSLTNQVTGSTGFAAITPSLNYVSIQTSGLVDDQYGGDSHDCSVYTCLKMHNGSVINYGTVQFAGTTSQNAIWMHIDPDGKYSGAGNTTAYGKSVAIFLYYNGLVREEANLLPSTVSSDGTRNPGGTSPPWFHW